MQDPVINKGLISVNLRSGMNQAESEYTVDPSSGLTVAVNAHIRNDGELEMRPGFQRICTPANTSYPRQLVDASNYIDTSNVFCGFPYARRVSSISTTTPHFAKGYAPGFGVTSVASSGEGVQLGGDNFAQRPCGSCASENYVFMFHLRPTVSGSAGVFVISIFERATGNLVYTGTEAAGSATDVMGYCGVTTDDVFVFCYVSTKSVTDTYTIKAYYKLNTGGAAVFAAGTGVTQTQRAIRGMVCIAGNAYVVSAASGSTPFVDRYTVSSAAVIASVANTAFPANFSPDACSYDYGATAGAPSTAQFIVTGTDSTNFARHAKYRISDNTFQSDTTTAVAATGGTNRVFGCGKSGTVQIAVTGTAATTLGSATLTTGIITLAAGSVVYGWLPSGNMFSDGNYYYLPVYGYATGGVQTEHAILQTSSSTPISGREQMWQLSAIIDQETSGAPIATTNYFQNHCVAVDTVTTVATKFSFQSLFKTFWYCLRRKNSSGSASYHAIELSPTPYTVRSMPGPGGLRVSAGGYPLFDDGARVGELGVFGIPQIANALNTSGTGLAQGSYIYYAVYVASDDRGNVAYSRVTTLSSVTTGVGGDDVSVVVLAPTLTARCSSVAGTNYNMRVDVYRTKTGGTIPYLLCTSDPAFSTRVMTSAGNGFYTYNDAIADATLSVSTQLFRQPGVTGSALDRYVPPASNVACVYKDRIVWGDPYGNIWYSSPFILGEQPWTNPFFKIEIPFGTGPVTMLQSWGGKLYIGKRDMVAVIEGDGPPENGGNGTEFSIPYVVVDGYGPIHERGSCVSPTGIFYRTSRGIEAITGNGASWVGKRVRRWLDYGDQEVSDRASPTETMDMVYHPYTGYIYTLVQAYKYSSQIGSNDGVAFSNVEANTSIVAYDTVRDTWFVWAVNGDYSVADGSPTTFIDNGAGPIMGGLAVNSDPGTPSLVCLSANRYIGAISFRGELSTATGSAVTGSDWYNRDEITELSSPVQMRLDSANIRVTGPSGKVRVYDIIALLARESSNQAISFRTFVNYNSSAANAYKTIAGNANTYPQFMNYNPPTENVSAQRFIVLAKSCSATWNTIDAFDFTTETAPVKVIDLSVQVGEKPGIPLVGTSQKGTS